MDTHKATSTRKTPARIDWECIDWESHRAGIKRTRDELEPLVGPLTDFQAQCFINVECSQVAQCCANRIAGPHRELMEARRRQKWSLAFRIARGLVKAHGIPTRDEDLDPLVMRDGIATVGVKRVSAWLVGSHAKPNRSPNP